MKKFRLALLVFGFLLEAQAACINNISNSQNLTEIYANCANATQLVWTIAQGVNLTNEILHDWPLLENISLTFQNKDCNALPLNFNNMTSLKAVSLRNAFPCLDYLSADYFVGSINLIEVRISDNPNLIEVHPEIFHDQANLLQLELTHNALAYLPRMLFKRTRKLRTLNLSHNKFKEVAFKIPTLTISQLPTNLTHLDISYNSLSSLNAEDLAWCKQRNKTLSLKLSGNPWQCDCAAKDFVKFVNAMLANILDGSALRCQNTSALLIAQLKADELCSHLAMIVGGIFGCLALVVAVVALSCIKAVRIWLYSHGYCLWWVLDADEGDDKPCDAFVTCAPVEEDILWELIRKLEDCLKPYKLCWYNRNVHLGCMQDEITKLVRSSRRVIIVLSPMFLETIWARKELRMVLHAAMEERKRFIVIRYKHTKQAIDFDKKLKLRLKFTTFLDWGEANFWSKLRYALPHQK